MRTHARFPVAAALMLVCGLALPVMGQQGGAGPAKVQPVQPVHPGNPVVMGGRGGGFGERPDNPMELTVSLEFPGGTLDQYARALRATAGESPVNILYSREVGEIEVPPVSLKQASVYGAMQSLMRIAATKQGQSLVVETQAGVITVAVSNMYNATSVFRSNEAERPMLEVMSIRDLLESADPQAKEGTTLPADTVLTAVTQALEMMSKDNLKAPTIKYHKESGLLLVSGSPNQVHVVNQALSAMRSDLAQRQEQGMRLREAEMAKERSKRLSQERIAHAESQLATATRQVVLAEKALAEATALHKQGAIPEANVRVAQEKFERAREAMQQVEDQVQRVRDSDAMSTQPEAIVYTSERRSRDSGHDELLQAVGRLEGLINQSNDLLRKISEETARAR